ncbi:MAG: hypothetical protein D8M58_12285 [Calditrichaeota bacterium]|nr:MAG: hypothetical protein DWQ03_13070 [Calditrichota bacterium]MBL1206175.1 hypothetical protein [Calditrichota bacterium]NOG46000.1 hypothetical protein [Calditrichota bacterium]
MFKTFKLFIATWILISSVLSAQDRTILVPRQVPGAPFSYNDQNENFGKAYRWFHEGVIDSAVDNLKNVIANSGYSIDPKAYYVVLAHFSDSFAPIGIIHGEQTDFFNTRLYGLEEENLYYVFISQTENAPSFLSVMATAKNSPFMENLPGFLGLVGLLGQPVALQSNENTVWVDVRRFSLPKVYQDFSDLSFLVKKQLSDESPLATIVFDNTAKERWSYGFAMALTSVRDVDLVVGSDGTIIVRPKPEADLAGFAVINYHFQAIDTKAKSFGNSFHLLGGFRLAEIFEPIIGVGGGVSLGIIDLHAFVGYSFEFTNSLKKGFEIGDTVTSDTSPFKSKVRGKPRFGIEIKLN